MMHLHTINLRISQLFKSIQCLYMCQKRLIIKSPTQMFTHFVEEVKRLGYEINV